MDTYRLNTARHEASPAAGSEPTDYPPVLDHIVHRVRLRAQRRVAWLRHLWQTADAESADALNPHVAIDLILEARDDRGAEAAWYAKQPELAPLNDEITAVEAALAADRRSYLAHLERQFGLSERDRDLLHATLAVRREPELSRVFAYLQDHTGRDYVTDALVDRLFASAENTVLPATSPLRLWDLVQTREYAGSDPARYTCDPHLYHRLGGRQGMDEVLLGIAHMQLPQPALPSWPVAEVIDFIARRRENQVWEPVRIVVSGFAGSGRKTFAATVSERLGLPLLVVDTDRIAEGQWTRVYTHAQRHAYLEMSGLAWTGSRAKLAPESKIITPFQLQFVILEPDEHLPAHDNAIDYRVEMPGLSIEARRQVWQAQFPESQSWPAATWEDTVRRFPISIGQVTALARRGVSGPVEVAAYLSTTARHRLGKLAQHLPCPFRWDDLVLDDRLKQLLTDFLFEAREREAIWEERAVGRLFPRGRGLIALFSGPPGTGKTMAAQVVAAGLGLDLYRIDLSSVVSKYVGETSKNLERILAKARHINAVLLFDEADALFGKRTDIKDAHDRYANTDTNYLLQAVESYAGIAILATNKKANIDPGFIRRLRYVLEFPKPDEAQRLQLWRHLVAEIGGSDVRARLQTDLAHLAAGTDLNGAQIKSALLSALFLARRQERELDATHLLVGVERELTKEGRNPKPELRRKMNQL